MAKIEIDNKKMWEVLIRVAKGWTVQDPDTYDYLNGLITLAEIALEEQGLQCNELTGEIVSIEPEPFKIEAGKWYECIKDVIMKPVNSLAYIKGKIYKSESDGYLTDEYGIRLHGWYDCVKIMEHFRPATAEEIPHKFKVGDWVVRGGYTYQVERVDEYMVLIKSNRCEVHCGKDECKLWDLSQAKDGDVLTYYGGQWIFIFKAFGEGENEIAYYALLTEDGLTFNNYNYSVSQYGFKPATKEQRDTLFKAMREAGYEWDENEKKLYKLKDVFDAVPVGELHTQVRIPVVPEFNIEAGKWYRCIKDFTAAPGCGFKEGSLYLSEKEDCLTDDYGFKENTFGRDAAIWFRPATEEELSQCEVTKKSDQEELTEFEKAVEYLMGQVQCGHLVNLTVTTKEQSKKLFSIARKQFIEEACEYIYLHIGELNDLYIRTALREEFIEDFRKALEKGE